MNIKARQDQKAHVIGVGVYGKGRNDSTVAIYSSKEHKRAWTTWQAMLRSSKYRGRSVCEEWLSFETFKVWWFSHNYDHLGEKYYFNIADKKKPYSPDNCYISDTKKYHGNQYGNQYSNNNKSTKTLTK